MSTTGAIGYIDLNGKYRATSVYADMDPEDDVSRVFASMFGHITADEFSRWVERGITGGGYDGLYNQETKGERGEAKGPELIDDENYYHFHDFTYVVANGKLSFFDPKNVMEYDDERLKV
jgi:hypothetical protein